MNTTPRKFYDGMAGMPAPGQIDKKMTPMEELIEQLKKLSPESPMGNDVSKAFHGGIQLAILKAKFLLEAEREYASQQAPASTPPVSAMEDVLPTQEQIDAAIDKYAFRVPYNGSNSFYDEAALKHFKAGIEWFKSALTTPTK